MLFFSSSISSAEHGVFMKGKMQFFYSYCSEWLDHVVFDFGSLFSTFLYILETLERWTNVFYSCVIPTAVVWCHCWFIWCLNESHLIELINWRANLEISLSPKLIILRYLRVLFYCENQAKSDGSTGCMENSAWIGEKRDRN